MKFYYMTGINLAFHIAKILTIITLLIKNDKILVKNTNCILYLNLLFFIWLAINFGIVSFFLLYNTYRKFRSQYIIHRLQFWLMILTLTFCLGNTIYTDYLSVYGQSQKKYLNTDLWYAIKQIAQLAPVIVYILTKKIEDCLTCFNKFSVRYSNLQYSAQDEELKQQRKDMIR